MEHASVCMRTRTTQAKQPAFNQQRRTSINTYVYNASVHTYYIYMRECVHVCQSRKLRDRNPWYEWRHTLYRVCDNWLRIKDASSRADWSEWNILKMCSEAINMSDALCLYSSYLRNEWILHSCKYFRNSNDIHVCVPTTIVFENVNFYNSRYVYAYIPNRLHFLIVRVFLLVTYYTFFCILNIVYTLLKYAITFAYSNLSAFKLNVLMCFKRI